MHIRNIGKCVDRLTETIQAAPKGKSLKNIENLMGKAYRVVETFWDMLKSKWRLAFAPSVSVSPNVAARK
jgi:hypothetical protein